MKLFNLLLISLLLIGSEVAAADKVMIAIMDASAVINGTNAAKQAREILKTETTKAQAKIDSMETTLIGQQKELQAKKSILSSDKYADEEDKLRKEFRDFRAKAQEIQEELDKKNLKLRKEITDTIKKVVDKMAKERDYQIVLAKNMVLYSADYIDISDEVLKRVNKELKK